MDNKLKYLKYKNKYLVLKKQYGGYLTVEEKRLLEQAGFEKQVIHSLEMQNTTPEYIAGIIAGARTAIASGVPAYEDIEKQITLVSDNLDSLRAQRAEIEQSNNRQLEELNKSGLMLTFDNIRLLFNHGWTIHQINEFGMQVTPGVRDKVIQDASRLPLQIPDNIKEITERINHLMEMLASLIKRR